MNIYKMQILKQIHAEAFVNQRSLAACLQMSLGKVNSCLGELVQEGYLNSDYSLSPKGLDLLATCIPKNAIILAAGYGLRMVPINTEIPKGLLEVKGEVLIERLIRQLKESGVEEIYVVVGYQKEKYEYLMDSFGVELIVNMDYASRNNLHSLARAARHLGNSYILPCDLWCRENPFSHFEPYTWYMVLDRKSPNSTVRVNRQKELVAPGRKEAGNSMIGISYISGQDAPDLIASIDRLTRDPRFDNSFWEDALFTLPGKTIYAHTASERDIIEINTLEHLRDIDQYSEHLQSPALAIISETFGATVDEISHIETLKKGMTNRSFLFTCRDQRCIMRIPGEGTDKLINRRQEAAVYEQLSGRAICDDVLYMNPENGYKITRYLEHARNCDPTNEQDLIRCMKKLRAFHEEKLTVDHSFDIFGQIDYYESLWQGASSIYRDYETTKAHVLSLKSYIDAQPKECVLTHIDAVPDNFLLLDETGNIDQIRLIDWEYAGMQDPHVDIAMFCIYSLYSRGEVDHLIDLYFKDPCPREVRIKIYCYIAACGLLWSNWCEYKSQLGIEFGEYALRQYRYAKDYYRIACSEMSAL